MENLLSYTQNHLLESLLLTFFLGILLAAFVAWLWLKKSRIQFTELADEKLYATAQLHEQQLLQIQSENEKVHTENKHQNHELMRLNKLTVKLAEQYKHSQEQAQLADEKQQALTHAEKQITQLKSEVEHQTIRFKEQSEFIANSQTTLSDHFNTLGQKILEEKTARFTENNKEQMNLVVNPLHKQLKEFQALISHNTTEGIAQQKSMKSAAIRNSRFRKRA